MLALQAPKIRERIGELLKARDESGFSLYLVELVLEYRYADALERLAGEALNAQPPDVQAWWEESCEVCIPAPRRR